MKIFETYTGNAMLNNALMTVEALGNLKEVAEITSELLLRLYNDKGLLKINKRIKSYTMLFTKNGPLYNDKTNGEKIYDALLKTILSDFENEGELICEISGLKFQTPFYKVFEKTLRNIGISEKEIKNKDTNIGRTWFPLIGGLGSDAQALPQAKFTVQIHPICIVIIQFLPLSSFLYNGGILLIDSSNFKFTKEFIAKNVQEIEKRIKATKSTDSIKNIKDFSKGNYLLKALKILEEKNWEETYSDLNLWSFSNSGNGASCVIDQVPNNLIHKLIMLNKSGPGVRSELEKILNRNESAYSFLSSLEENKEWGGLYPATFGTGKKQVAYEGVSAAFLEAYYKATDNIKQINYAKYIAYLINGYKSKSFEKYLSSTSAWDEKTYRIDLYAVLVEATKKKQWSLNHQLQILDNMDTLPVRNTFYELHRLIHYFYQKQIFIRALPTTNDKSSNTREACYWLITLIQQDENREKIIKGLTTTQDYIAVGYTGVLIRSYTLDSVSLKSIAHYLYDENFLSAKNGLNELLRIFFSQPDQNFFNVDDIGNAQLEVNDETEKWFENFSAFAKDYQTYYFDKYTNKQIGRQPYNKFLKLLLNISMETSDFLYWFREAIENTNQFLNNRYGLVENKWSEALFYNPQGELAIPFAKLAIKFSLLKQYQLLYQQNQTVNS